MADFQKYVADQSLAGPARFAVASPALAPAADPTDVDDIMDANYDWVSTPIDWQGKGATNGGIKVTAGWTEFEIKHDLSEHVRSEITDTSLAIETSLAELGNLDNLRIAWLILGDSTTTTTGGNSYVGLGARRSIPERSLAVVHVDPNGKMRIFYFRTVRNTAADSQLNLAPGASQEAALNLRAYKHADAPAESEYGGIFTEDNYAGVAV